MKKIILSILTLLLSVSISYNLLAAAPTTAASNITFSNLTNTGVKVSWTSGNGLSRIVVVNQGSAVTWIPANSTQLTGVSNNFTTAANQGSGNKVVYNSTSNSVSITGLTSGQTYYVTIYEYNGTNSSSPYTATYLTSGAPVANVSILSPSINVAPASLSGFTAAIGGTSAEQSYVVSGSQLFTNLVIAPGSSNYKVSTTSGGPYSSSINLVPVSNTVSPTTIYVVLVPTGSPGTKSGSILNSSTGATTNLVSVAGIATAVTPTVAASNLVFSNVQNTAMTIGWTSGNGTNRIVVIRQGSAVNYIPTDQTQLSGVNANFSSATDQGNGNKVVYNNNGNSVNIAGLTSGQTYYVTIYEYNGSNTSAPYTAAYQTTGALSGNTATFAPSITAVPLSLSGFTAGIGATSAEQTYSVSASQLYANLTITAPTNFQISTTSGGPYSSSLILTPVSNTISSTTIYVVMIPSGALGAKSGNISHTTSGATTQNVALSGTAIIVAPTTAASNITFTSVTNTTVKINWTSGNGANRIVVVKQGSSVNWTPTDFTQLTGVNANFSSATDQGSGNVVVYNSTNNFVTVTGLTSGQTYYVAVYEYNGTNSSSPYTVTYQTSGAPVGNVTLLSPSISVNPTSLSGFATTIGGTSAEQTYTVSGSQLFANFVISSGSANYKVSTTSGGPYSSSVTLVPVSNTIVPTVIYVVFAPTGSLGTKSGSILNSSTGVTTIQVSVTGTANASVPTVAASNLIFSGVATTSMTIGWTSGDGTGRIVVAREGAPVNWVPTDLTALNGVSSNYTTATDQGNGNKVLYNGTGNSIGVSGLSGSKIYYVTVYEYNGVNTVSPYTVAYLTSASLTGSRITLATSPTSQASITSAVVNSLNPTTQVDLTFTNGTGSSGVIIVVRAATSQNDSPANFTTYSNSTDFSTGTSLTGIDSPSDIVTYVGNGTTATITNLTPNTTYSFGIYAFNDGGLSGSENYLTPKGTLKIVTTAASPAFVWTGATSLDWQVATNWTPNRIIKAITDTLKFTSSPSGTITNVPSETIQKLIISGASTDVTLQSAVSGNTISLTLATGSGNALSISSGSSLNLDGSNQLNITVPFGSSADVAGNINLSNANHTIGTTGAWTFGATSTVSYNGGANQTVASLGFYNLVLSGSNTITLPSTTLSLGGSFTNNNTGSVLHNNGTVGFTGNSAIIGGSSTTNFNNIILGSGASVTVSHAENLLGTLTLGAASVFNTTGQTFTLVSNASSTARIDVVPSDASFTGNIVMQRYIPAAGGRYWYHLSTPVTGATFLQLKTSNVSGPPTNPDNGIFITGNGIANTTPNIPSIGITNTNTASVYYYNSATAKYTIPTDLANTFPTKVGYRFFISDGSAAIAPTTFAKNLALTGTPNIGDQSFSLVYSTSAAGVNFLGNPYPSDITADLSNSAWNTSSANLADHVVYIYNSDAANYVTCINGVPSSAGACNIPSFQSFWVTTSSGGGTLIASENVKVSGSSTIFKVASDNGSYAIPVTITNTASKVSHGTLIRFDKSATLGYDNNLDALQFSPEGIETTVINVNSQIKQKEYSINTLPYDVNEVIGLTTNAPLGENTLSFEGLNIPAGLNAFLIDNYTGDITDISNTPTYSFIVSADQTSVKNRFKLAFSNGSKSSVAAIDPTNTSAEMFVYPNPSKGRVVNVTLNNVDLSDATIVVYDALGNITYKKNITSSNTTIDLTGATTGIYSVVCVSPNGSFTEKVVIE